MRAFLPLAALILLAACAARPERPARPLTASPGEVVAAEVALGRLARAKGQFTALRETAAREAELFVPNRVQALAWLNDRPDPPKAERWQVGRVYLSCDGRTAATTGSTTLADGAPGMFTAIWAKDEGGRWVWLLAHGQRLGQPRPLPDPIESRIAACIGKPNAPLTAPMEDEDLKVGFSRDQSLRFASAVRPDRSRRIEVSIWTGDRFETVILDEVAGSAAGAGG